MLFFIFRRFLVAVPTIWVAITLSFFLVRLAPGGPFDKERPLDPNVLINIRHAYHLDEPLYTQYWNYLNGILHGDFGPSFMWRDFSVSDLLLKGLPASMQLGSWALLLAIIIGSGLGLAAAIKQNSWLDRSIVGFAALCATIPIFVVGPLLQLFLGLTLRLLPLGGWSDSWADGGWRFLIMPVITLALPQMAVVARLIRSAVIEVLGSNPVRTLKANGLSSWTIYRHVLRAACLPTISYLGPAAVTLLTGSLVVEDTFGISGVGRYFVQSALDRDFTVVMGTVVLVAVLVIFFNLVVDILYALIDPRVRYE